MTQPTSADMDASPRRQRAASIVALLIVLAAFAFAARAGTIAEKPWPVLAGLLVAGAAWWWALSIAPSARPSWALVLIGALALRGIALAADFEASDDGYRYAWEAEVVLDGASPYSFPPSAPELERLRTEQPELIARVAHRDVPAAYPPLAQLSSLLGVLTAHAVGVEYDVGAVQRILRVVATVWDLAVLGALAMLLRASSRPPALCVAWAWSPLVGFEFAGSGHFDALGIALWTAAIAVALRRERGIAASLLLSAAVLVKFLPVCSLPFARNARSALRNTFVVAVCVALALAAFMPLRGGVSGLFSGLFEYGRRWESTNLLYRFIEPPLRIVMPAGSALEARLVARGAMLALWLCAAWFMRRSKWHELRAAFWLTGLFLVLSPTLHPWYLTWMVPFVAVHNSRAWRWLIAVAPILYSVLPRWHREGVWLEPSWLWPVVALPFFALLAFEAWSGPRNVEVRA